MFLWSLPGKLRVQVGGLEDRHGLGFRGLGFYGLRGLGFRGLGV